jgi:hypothetical protein
MTGFQSKRKAALDRDAEIERLNEKIEFLARTNMLYSDWEHRETQVTSDLIRKGIEEAKINAELRAEIAELNHGDALTIAYQSGHYDGKKAPQRPWVGIPEEDLKQGDESFFVAWREGARWADAYLKEKNNG